MAGTTQASEVKAGTVTIWRAQVLHARDGLIDRIWAATQGEAEEEAHSLVDELTYYDEDEDDVTIEDDYVVVLEQVTLSTDPFILADWLDRYAA